MTNSRRVAIAALDDQGLDGEVSAHFGRCPHYVMVDTQQGAPGRVEVITNPYYDAHQPGVMPGFLNEQGADVVIAGGMGPRAIQMFDAFGVEVVTGVVGNVGKVLEAYLRGEVTGTVPCNHDHPESCGEHGPGGGTGQGGCHE
ncbi:MAG: NifB/NifX family molybdenum-iron cluster-binding protein [Deltaproteobacteria bacterium]|nr:NifB/NifX family molybdenum-iron cluster-binding protein [Deltaproteobacteria bacterium]